MARSRASGGVHDGGGIVSATGLSALGSWPLRRWVVAVVTAMSSVVVVGVPTDLIDTGFFSREVPPTAWAWPALLVSSLLGGLLVASYVAGPRSESLTQTPAQRRGGWLGAALTYFAVGCPVCNKIVLLALGSAGAMTWFEPVQPFLQVIAVAALALAVRSRLRGELSCSLVPTGGPVHV